jgi:hypothetical protein
MELAEIVITLYLRCTTSPSEARNTSSPCSRNARRVPFAAVAVPKNVSSIGGGGGGPGGGGGGPGGKGFPVLTDAIGFGISTGTELLEKIFRPPPEYTSDSVTSIASIRKVGSSCAEVVPRFFAALPTAFPGGIEITAPDFVPADPDLEVPTTGLGITGAVIATGGTGGGLPLGSSKYKIPPASSTNPATAATFFCRSGVIFIIATDLRPQPQQERQQSHPHLPAT